MVDGERRADSGERTAVSFTAWHVVNANGLEVPKHSEAVVQLTNSPTHQLT